MIKRHVLLLTAVLGMAAAQTVEAQTVPTLPSTPSGIRTAQQDPNLTNARITVNTGSYVGPLSVLLASIAKSAGYEVIFNFNVDALALINGEIVTASMSGGAGSTGTSTTGNTAGNQTGPSAPIAYASPIGRPQELPAKPVTHSFASKPFNEVWPLLMDVYELNYEIVRLGGGNILRISQRPRQLSIVLAHTTAVAAREKTTEFFGEAAYKDEDYVDNTGTKRTRKVFDGYRLPDTLKILADTENNRLIVGGTNEQVDKVRSFVSTIDIPKQASNTVIQGQATYNVNGSVDDVISVLKTRYPSVQVIPFGSGRQLLLNGPKPQLDEIQSLLTLIDSASNAAIASTSKIYQVKGQQADALAVLTAQYPTLKVTPVGTTGQLIVTGPQSQLDAALALLGQVDRAAPAAGQTTQRVFTLINASAEEVKATLEGTLARDLTNTGSNLTPNATLINPLTGQPYTNGPLANMPVGTAAALSGQSAGTANTGAAASAPATAATIIADKRTNTLIVRGTPEQVAQIAELVPTLDTRVPQINVQIRIQEITETAARSLGVDWKASFGGFSVTAGGGGLTAAFDPTQNLVGFNLGPTLKTLETQGVSKSVYDGSVTMQSGQRALGAGTDTQNSSSTAAASIKSGGRLEINIPSQAANVPAIQKQVDYGVNLDFFSPQVAPDGTITLRVRGQVNDLRTPLEAVDSAGAVPNVLRFTNSEAQTTLTFKSGQTLLLSGLLADKDTVSNGGVPFLSQIPVIGGLFGSQSKSNTKTQLLVVITGTVVK